MAKKTLETIMSVVVLLVVINLGIAAYAGTDYMASWIGSSLAIAVYVIAGIIGAIAIWAFAKQKKNAMAWLSALVPLVLLNQAILVAFNYDVLGLLGSTIKMVLYVVAAVLAAVDLYKIATK